MRSKLMKRCAQVEGAVAAAPWPATTVTKAFDEFRETGRLPDHSQLAERVVQRALQPAVTPIVPGDGSYERALANLARLAEALEEELANPAPPRPRVREHLFREAVHGAGLERDVARDMLIHFVGSGLNPCDPEFLADKTMPEYGSVAMHLLGFPQGLAIPPYEARAQRLFARYDEIRASIDYDNPRWFEGIEYGIHTFRDEGVLPPPGVVRDAVLADAELQVLMRHFTGHDVTEEMASLDRIHQLESGAP